MENDIIWSEKMFLELGGKLHPNRRFRGDSPRHLEQQGGFA